MAKETAAPLLTVSVEGEGLSPSSVSLRELAQLIQALATALELSGGDRPARFSLTSVRPGSAKYALDSKEPDAEHAVRTFMRAVETRGDGCSVELHAALMRVHEASRLGAITLQSRPGLAGRKAVTMARPIEREPRVEEFGRTFYGRIVGLFIKGEHTVLRLRRVGSGSVDLRLADGAESSARSQFGRDVRVRVVTTEADSRLEHGVVEYVERWSNDPVLDVLMELRAEFASEGIDGAAWLRELEGEA